MNIGGSTLFPEEKEAQVYEGELKDIIIDIPTNTVEMTLTLKVYTDGEIQECERHFDMQDIRDAEQTFDDCVNGEYPLYALTDKVEELFDDDELPY